MLGSSMCDSLRSVRDSGHFLKYHSLKQCEDIPHTYNECFNAITDCHYIGFCIVSFIIVHHTRWIGNLTNYYDSAFYRHLSLIYYDIKRQVVKGGDKLLLAHYACPLIVCVNNLNVLFANFDIKYLTPNSLCEGDVCKLFKRLKFACHLAIVLTAMFATNQKFVF